MCALENPHDTGVLPELVPVKSEPISPEVYRQLYVALDLPPVGHQVIGLTSAISGEGRTTVAMGLGRTLAADLRTPVVLVDADLDSPSLADHFGVATGPGLSDVLRGERRFEDVMYPVSDNLLVVPAGAPASGASGLLRHLSDHLPVNEGHDVPWILILDLPAVMTSSYTAIAARAVHALALVVRAGVTPMEVVREAIGRLEDQPPQGIVFNAPRSSLPGWWPDGGA